MGKTIELIEAKDLNKDSLILDVRTQEEIDEESIALPFIHSDSVTFNAEEFLKNHNFNGKTINILCRSGFRATNVAEQLINAGYSNVKVINGGIEKAKEDGVLQNL